MEKTFEVTITYLEQQSRPALKQVSPPAGKYTIVRAEQPPLHYYRYLFDQVGAEYHWVSRRYMGDEELKTIIHDTDVYIYTLTYNGAPIGLAEIDARKSVHSDGEVEIKFFGLMAEAMGKGIGRWFLNNAIDLAWSLNPKKVIIETCTADHPAALSLYQKHGFSVYAQGHGIINWRG